uniref:Retrotransposon protein, putative, Ty3-gypsy subclass n=1 Tax=Oryza sativa subsp. japonica TaxID=39947 RepID=Q10G13_ORYSJ|nr:retrotransposon protein, putative, Ty3-gypsy subclass [Oryza sativa Japonica Group]
MAGCLEHAAHHDTNMSNTAIIPSTELVNYYRFIAQLNPLWHQPRGRGGADKRAPPVGDSREAGAPWTKSTHALVRGRTTWQTRGTTRAPTRGGTGRPRGRPRSARAADRAATGRRGAAKGSGGRGRAGRRRPTGKRRRSTRWSPAAGGSSAGCGGTHGRRQGWERGSLRGRGRRGEGGKAADDEDWRRRFSGWGRGRRSDDSRPRRRYGRGPAGPGEGDGRIRRAREDSRRRESPAERKKNSGCSPVCDGGGVPAGLGRRGAVAEELLVLAEPREATAWVGDDQSSGTTWLQSAHGGGGSGRWWRGGCGGDLGKQSGCRCAARHSEPFGGGGAARQRRGWRWQATGGDERRL